MWLKRLRLAIALGVVLFAAAIVVSLVRGRTHTVAQGPAARIDPNAVVENRGGGATERTEHGKTTFSLKFGNQLTYADGHTKLGGGVTVVLPDRDGRTVTINSLEANILNPPEHELSHAEFSGGVKLTTSDGITVTGTQASYDDHEAMVRVPGNVTFTKGRMTGTGVGATYDRNREVLWLLDQAKIDVTPDEKGGGAMHATSATAGMARIDHYMKFTKNAHLEGEGRIIDADEATIYLDNDDKKVQRMELRGNSRITATDQQANGAQSMSAQAIDLAYGEDGRTLQTAKLVDNAVVKLPGAANAAREVAGRTIDIVMAPDGSTVTSLIAQENVQVDLPPDGDTPARRIKSASLAATGAPGAGLQNAAFTGGVDFREARAATKDVAAIDRTARSQRLDVQTKPGFGDLERADFHGNVHFTDGADTTADAPLAVYNVAQDRLDLSPGSGDTGMGPHVANGRLTVDAARIQMTLGTQSLNADTKVKSVLKSENKNQPPPAAKPAARGGRAGAPAPVAPLPAAQSSDSVKMPSILKSSEPVNVTANRLEYDGNASRAVYTGAARLWQPDTVVRADKITLDEKTGNLHALTGVVTVMTLSQPADKQKPAQKTADATKKPPAPTTTTAEELLYEDGLHRATYTTKAHMNGPDGDVTAEKIELYLTENGGELERAEADGSVVSRQQDQQRRAYGDHLTYLSAKDEYTMVGKPVKVFDDKPPDCKLTVGTTLTFHQAVDTISATGNGVSAGTKTETIACGTAGQP